MKTKVINRIPVCRIALFFLLMFSLQMAAVAQELEQLISSKVEIIDQQDRQFLDCNTYRFGDEVLYDNPNLIRLYENEAYRFDLNFSYFAGNSVINPRNYLDKFYSVKIPESVRENYRITAITPKGDNVSIYAIATGQAGNQDTFRIQLFDDKAELLADAIYPFQVREDVPGATETAFLPMKMEYKPIFVRFEDVNNPNNRIERQLLPFSPDTINLDAREAFNFITEIEEEVQLGSQSYVLVANHENNYGYQVSFEWQGKSLRDKPASKNGMKAYLTTVPGRDRPTAPTLDLTAIMASDLKMSGLDRQGKRIQQEFIFVEPNTKLNKVYQTDYIRKHPELIRERKDPKNTEILIHKYLPAMQYHFKEANKNVLQYYQVNPQKAKIYQKSNTQVQPTNKAKVITAKPGKEKYSVVESKEKMKVASPNVVRVNPTKTTTVQRNNEVLVAKPVPVNPPPKGDYYTIAIKVSRETEVMSHRTYLLTFRIIN
ncbi:hypothetical protein [Flavilitoribacter nigricans]|uniref:DUF5103 domain-containing protein n=1 Tax=Flavilitoribacter nigricans (strain ATCC 23147 / DSM 23189 / NBRC 102662 / NCIMB 1420 / SS-2) TaxID=1122177 RepID=A0A2D0NDL0_FLAN2|nr:hypothetical protein [Flavilitoribacter nigricans]PHN05853.1 hypothetical protein CRP01_15395 [Flavilitoribacter nigricans DSM 23189 = NBRC 102662]